MIACLVVSTFCSVVVVPAVGSHRLRQPGPASRDPGSDRSRGDSQDRSDLGVVTAGHVTKHDRCSKLLGQLGQRGIKVESRHHRSRVVGTGRAGEAVACLDNRGHRASAASTQLVQRGVGRYPVGPGRELGFAVEAGEPPDDGNERFLGGVLPVGVVARQAPADGVDLIVVAPQQLLERMPVPRLGGPDEPGVVEVVANRTRLLAKRVYAAGTW